MWVVIKMIRSGSFCAAEFLCGEVFLRRSFYVAEFLCGGVFACLGSLCGQSFCMAGVLCGRVFVWPGFHAARDLCGWDLFGHVALCARADSRKLDKQITLPKKEIRLLTNLRLLPPSSPYSLASSTNKMSRYPVSKVHNVFFCGLIVKFELIRQLVE